MSVNADMSQLSDSELACCCKNGDSEAFNEAVRRYWGLIADIASTFRINGFETVDLVQEGLIVLFAVCRTFDESYGASFKNYLAVCVKRRFISILREENGSQNNAVSFVTIDSINEEEDPAQNPEERLYDKERLDELVLKLKERLSDFERKALVLKISGLSYAEISQKLGVSVKSVENALVRSRKKLRD